jgi:chromosome segregation ATPase
VTGRGVAMHSQRRLDSQLKRERVAAAVDACIASGAEVTIAGVARHARVSRKFIYSHPDLRAELELRALRATQSTGATATASARVTGASLRADAENYKAQGDRLRQQVRALEQRLSEALGSEFAAGLPSDERVDHASLEELRGRLDESQARTFELEETLADAREELEAVREINRELLSQHNRAAG